ncbi:MAG: hypothetical protein ACKOCT_07180 [Alphaproteobacteria bacterium]
MERGGWTRREGLRSGVTVLAGGAWAGVAGLPSRAFADGPAAPAGTTGASSSTRAADERTAAMLRELIDRRALAADPGVPNLPWLWAHVILALGPDVKRNGKPIIEPMVADALELVTIEGKPYPRFAPQVERHPFHFLQILQAVGIPYERRFVTPRGTYSRREIVSGSEAVFEPGRPDADEASWTICVLAHEFPPSKDRFRTARGAEVAVSDLVENHLRDTEEAYAPIFASMDEGKGYGRGPIHSKACNGAHLVYGLIDALRYGYRGHSLPERFDRLLRATIFRLQLEQKLVDATLRSPDPMTRLNADAIKLSFLGHLIEDIGYGVSCGVVKLDDKQQEAVARARLQLGAVVERIGGEHDLDRLRAEVPNAYSVLLGDACHALRGVRFWT